MYFNNELNLDGRLVSKPELKETKSGTKFCHFSLCYNERRKNPEKENDWISIPHYFNCTAWKKEAVNVSSFEKGQCISVIGKLQYSEWTENNNKKSAVYVLANHIRKLEWEKKETNEDETDLSSDNYEPIPQQFDIV